MNYGFVGLALMASIFGLRDLWKFGWLPLRKPEGTSPRAVAGWLADRTYLLYAAVVVASLIAAVTVRD